MSYAMKSGLYKLAMKKKNPIKTLKQLFNQYNAIFCPKIEKLAKFRFMFFDRNLIHIQDFQEIPPAKLISGDSSSSTFHDFKKISFRIIKISRILNFKN